MSHAFRPYGRVGRSSLLLAKKSIALVKDSLSRSAREMELSLVTLPWEKYHVAHPLDNSMAIYFHYCRKSMYPFLQIVDANPPLIMTKLGNIRYINTYFFTAWNKINITRCNINTDVKKYMTVLPKRKKET